MWLPNTDKLLKMFAGTTATHCASICAHIVGIFFKYIHTLQITLTAKALQFLMLFLFMINIC